MTRNELKKLAEGADSVDLADLACEIRCFLDNPPEPIPTNDTLVRLAAIGSAVQRCLAPNDEVGEAFRSIGDVLVEAATNWFDDASFAYTSVVDSRERLRYWAFQLRESGDDQYAGDVDTQMDRIRRILLDLR